MKKAEHFSQHSNNIAAQTWHKKTRVIMVSTYHTNEMHVSKWGKGIIQPIVVLVETSIRKAVTKLSNAVVVHGGMKTILEVECETF